MLAIVGRCSNRRAILSPGSISILDRPTLPLARMPTPMPMPQWTKQLYIRHLHYQPPHTFNHIDQDRHRSMNDSLEHVTPSRPSVPSSPPSSSLSLPQPSTSLSLPRPGSIQPEPARIPFRPRRPLPPKTQKIIDKQLKPFRRKHHPDWLEKPFERKMTLLERNQLLTAQHQKWDLQHLNRYLRKTQNPFASIQFIDRAHESVNTCTTNPAKPN